ncbi:vWA domain-containing protein [Aestuariimicrobium soli]|uniref:vWA domain-containing protein n=1 Tax=Aestuariimicrobium soli TaxID=2035834 RepID=UPI003EBA3821
MADGSVDPASVTQASDPGTTITVTKTITTPAIPPKPDIVLVADATGSMGTAINSVKTEMANIVNTVKAAQPDAQFAVTSYRDEGDAYLFNVASDLSSDVPTLQAAINSISAGGGGDEPEAQLNALYQIGGGGDAIAFRPGSSRIIVWFGDAPGHDPSNGHSLADAVTSLNDVSARVIALSVGANRLNLTGQATTITGATGGVLLSGIPAEGTAGAVLEGLGNLPAEVTTRTTCDPGLSVSFDPALPQTVTSGENLVLTETITIAGSAAQGATLTCSTTFMVNGSDADHLTQSVAITVNDVTPPTISCGPGVNPDGTTPTNYLSSGFYQMVAADNLAGVTVTASDTKTGTVFGTYAAGSYFKLTQSVGGSPSVGPFDGMVDYQFKVKGDLLLTATDAAGNTATATCKVPPKQK